MDDRRNFQLNSTVTLIALDQVVLPARKIRRHSEAKQKKLTRSIGETGYFSPIVLDERNELIAGAARLEAAKRLGMTSVPAIVVRNLNEAQKKALRIALNRFPEDAVWDLGQLPLDLQDIVAAGLDLELTGFDAIHIDRLLTPGGALVVDDEVIEELPEKPVSRLGDVWVCGQHLLLCGDATDPAAYTALLKGEQATMVITDPPYNLSVGKDISGRGKSKHDEFVMGSGEMNEAEFHAFIRVTMERTREHSKDGSLHYWFIDWRHAADVIAVGKSVFTDLINVCIWAKHNWGMGAFYRSQHEMVVVLKNGDAPPINNVQRGRLGRNRSNLWQYAGGTSFSRTRDSDLAMHPTVKPVQMIADAIHDATAPNNIVLDPFGGSGTTILAAEMIKRRAVVIELDPKYVDVALGRFQRSTGLEPVLASIGKGLSTVAIERKAQARADQARDGWGQPLNGWTKPITPSVTRR